MSWEEYRTADFQEGFRYELIDGRLVVAAMPNPKHMGVWSWLYRELLDYSRKRPNIINLVSSHCEVVIPGHAGVSAPQPDVAAYQNFPTERFDDDDFSWNEVFPILVAEIVSPDSPDKDYYRNVTLYEQEQRIREYWIVDPRGGINNRTMRVYRRRAGKWQRPIEIGPGGKYTTKLLPGFCLRLEPLA